MTSHRFSSISKLTLLIFLCLSSLVILPLLEGTEFSQVIDTISTEPDDCFEQAELEDDILMVTMVSPSTASLSYSQFGAALPGFQSAFFGPPTPPPELA